MIHRFDDYEIDESAHEIRHDGVTVQIEPLAIDLILHLVHSKGDLVRKEELLDAVWGDQFVSDSALTTAIKTARRALGDDGQRQSVIKTVHGKGYRFAAEIVAPAASDVPDDAPLDLSIRFVEARGGIALAVGDTGSGAPLVKTANWLTQVDRDAQDNPMWSHWIRSLSVEHHFVRYDPRGSGLSDRDLGHSDLTDLDLWVDDLVQVVAAPGFEQINLLGVSQGGPIAIAFAAAFPERVNRLILYGTYARGKKRRGDQNQSDDANLQIDLARVGWTRDDDTYRAVFARQFVPDATQEDIKWFAQLLRSTTNATNAAQLEGAFHNLDLTGVARTVTVPTLVMHSVGDEIVPFEEGRHLAGLIPNARFVPLQSNNHILPADDPAFSDLVAEINAATGQA